MERYQKNLARWALTCPNGAKSLSAASGKDDDVTLCQSANGLLNLTWTLEGTPIPLHLNSDPLLEARQWFDNLLLRDAAVIYVYGVGLGYYYQAASEWLKADPERSLVFLESHPQIIRRLLETENGTDLLANRQVSLYLVDDNANKLSTIDAIVSLYCTSLDSLVSCLQSYSKIVQLQPGYTALRAKILFLASSYKLAFTEYSSFSTAFFRNFFLNYLFLTDSFLAAGLFGKFAGIPAIICGAGPSLDKNIDLLKTLEDRALILAGGTGLNALNAHGIMPHFGVGIDPNQSHFNRLIMNHAYEMPFFYRSRMLHEALTMVHGDKLYVAGSAGYEITKWMEKELKIEEKDEISEGFNVLNFSLDIARHLGCNPIICVGIDLAYSPNGASYASGLITHPIHDSKTNFKTKTFAEDVVAKNDINNVPVLTMWKWMNESFWYSGFAQRHPEVLLVNATEGGIGFPNVDNATLAFVCEKFLTKKYDLATRIHGEIQSAPLPDSATAKHIKELCCTLSKSLIHSSEIIQNILNILPSAKSEEEFLVAITEEKTKLCDECAYQAILTTFNNEFTRTGRLETNRILLDEEILPKNEIELKKIALNSKRYSTLKKAALYLSSLIQYVLKYFEEVETSFLKWKEEAEQEHLQQLRTNHPLPTPEPDELYSFENNTLTLVDQELGLQHKELFVPDVEQIEYPAGGIKVQQFYKNGELHGPSTYYSESGTILARTWFLNGKREGKMRTYYPNGSLHSLQIFRHGLREGMQLYFYPDGLPRSCLPYANDLLHGLVSLYFTDGRLFRQLHFIEGKRCGKEQIWDRRGILRIEADFQADLPVGTANMRHYNGSLAQEIIYDQKSHLLSQKEWDPEGKLLNRDEAKTGDYFDQAAFQTEALTQSLEDMVMHISRIAPALDQDFSPQLKELQKAMDRLNTLHQSFKKEADLDAEHPKEAVWKNSQIQQEMEREIKALASSMNQNFKSMESNMKKILANKTLKNPPST